jgi:rod shape-determining protein MreC
VAVVSPAAGRSAGGSFPSRAGSALKRRIVVAALVVVSLALITISFREPADGALHEAQSTAAAALRPFEVAIERVARPFRDVYGYFDELVGAREENARLRSQVVELRHQLIQSKSESKENALLRALLDYREGPTFPRDYRGLAAQVISRPPNAIDQHIGISVGWKDGVRRYDAVVTELGLIGQVTQVGVHTARVTLLSDEASAVSAIDLQTNAAGIVRHGQGPDSLILDRVSKKEVVGVGDQIVTAGWSHGELESLYPKGIPIGQVTNVGGADVELFQQVQIAPFADLSSPQAVLVLIPAVAR